MNEKQHTWARLKELWQPYLKRPVFYQVFTRFLTGLCAALLWDHFLNTGSIRRPLSTAFTVPAAFFALMGWFAWLRLDGIRAPVFDRKLFRRSKRHKEQPFADMIDYVDEDVIDYDELDDSEKDLCLLLSDLITCILFAAAALLWR